MTRVLVSSDWHADARTGGVDRIDDVEEAVEQTVTAAMRERCKLYVFAGDLADPDDAPRALRALELAIRTARRLSHAGIESWWIAGNHDVIEDGSGRSSLSPMRALVDDRVKVWERPSLASLPGARPGTAVAVLPFPHATVKHPAPAESLRYWKAGLRSGQLRGEIVAVFAHMTEASGVEPGEESLEMSRGRGVPFPFEECDPRWLLISGHWHRGQTFRTGPYELVIPGSLARLTHGEERSRPRYLVLEV